MLGIIFVVHTSIGGDKLVFRYPSVTRGKVSDETMMAFRQQHPIGAIGRGGTGGSLGGSGDHGSMDGSKNHHQDQSMGGNSSNRSNPSDAHFIYNLSSEILTPILTPKPTLCDMSFELMIENTKFIGHPTLLTNDNDSDSDTSDSEDNNNNNNNNNSSSNSSSNKNDHSNLDENFIDLKNKSTSSTTSSNSSSSTSTSTIGGIRRFSDSSNNKSNRSHRRADSKCKDKLIKNQSNSSGSSNNNNVNKNENSSSSGSSGNIGGENNKDKRIESLNNSTNSNNSSSSGSDELTLFNLVFVMSTNVGQVNQNRDNSLKRCALKIASALKHEQKRCGYISKQVHEIMLVRDGWLTEHTLDNGDEKPNHQELTNRILKASQLGMEIKQIYDALTCDRPASLRINKWINLHLNINNPDYYSEYPMRPYHALLINQETASLQPSSDVSPALQRLIEVAKPTKSFRDLQLETDLPLSYLYRLSSHLVYWSRAKIINMLTKNNVYVLTPPDKINNFSNRHNADGNLRDFSTNYVEISQKFTQLFPEFQFQDILFRFSTARPLAEHISKFHQSYHVTFLQIVCWLLQHELIMQLHTYIHLTVPYRQQPTTSPNTPLIYETPHFPMTPSHLLPHETSFFDSIDDATKSYQLFKRYAYLTTVKQQQQQQQY